MEQAKAKGEAEAQEAADKVMHAFGMMAAKRLEEDRAISQEGARAIARQEIEYYTMAAADGEEKYRPFALDEARCRDVRAGYMVTFRP